MLRNIGAPQILNKDLSFLPVPLLNLLHTLLNPSPSSSPSYIIVLKYSLPVRQRLQESKKYNNLYPWGTIKFDFSKTIWIKTSHFSIPNGLFLISKEFFLISIHFFSSSRQAILLFILLLTTVILPLNFLVVKPRALWTYIETSLAHCDLTLKYPRLSPIVRRWYVNPHPWPTVILPWNILIFRPLFLTLKYPVLDPLCSYLEIYSSYTWTVNLR